MPPILTAVLLYAVSTAAGFALDAGGRIATTWGAAAALALAAAGGGLLRRHRAAGYCAVAAAGFAMAARADTADAECRTRVLRGYDLIAVIDSDARPGGYVRGRTLQPCTLELSLVVARGVAPAGAVVRVRGLAWPAGRGLRVPDATVQPTGAVHRLPALRARTGRVLDRLFGSDAPLARALVIADARAIDPQVRERFADAGLVHALSVSGLHVAIVASALGLILRAARVPSERAGAIAALAVAGYIALIGAPAPAVRAGVMLGADAFSRALQRPTSPWAVFALGAAAPLVDPRVILDLGYQLSVAGMAALVGGRRAVAALRDFARSPDRIEPEPLRRLRLVARFTRRGLRATVAGELVVGVYAAVATAPLVAWHFGRVSVIGVLANLAAGPILGVLQPALFLAVLAAPFPPLAQLVADGSRMLLRILDAVAAVAARAPGGVAHSSPTLAGAACVGITAIALLVATAARRRRARWGLVAVGALATSAWAPLVPERTPFVELHAIDVGQGDAVALRTPRGRWVLFDAGRGGRGSDAGARVVVPYLRRHGGKLVALVLSHPHADHVGGAASVIRRLQPTAVWDAGFALGSDTYRDVLTATREVGARWHRVRPGDACVVDGVTLTVLAPDSSWTASLDDPNLASVVVRAEYRGVRFLLTGDAESPEEDWLRTAYPAAAGASDPLAAHVLKVAHHGSRTSTSQAFLHRVRPAVAVVSVGAGNSYGHPTPDVVRRLLASGADVRRTDALGSVVVRTDGRALYLKRPEGQWEMLRRAPVAVRTGS